MKRANQLVLAAALAAACAPALAQQAQGAPAARPAPASAAELAEGEVRKVDKSAGKITLKHGEIKSLDMPPMTMVFGVSSPALLEQVKVGDKVRFRASHQGGAYTVTELQVAK